jgi:four helix bundle protein
MQDFRRLRAWQKSHHLSLEIYLATSSFPTTERYGLTSQLRRASVSVASNIAEDTARSSDRDFRRFLGIAMSFASELEYQLLLSKDLEFINEEQHTRLSTDVQDVKRMLSGLIRSLGSSEIIASSDSG